MQNLKNKKATLLIFTLWIILVLSLFALGLAYSSRLEIRSISYEIDDLKSKSLINAAVFLISEKIKTDSYGFLDRPLLRSYTIEDYRLGEGKFSILGIVDEERKININKVPFEILERILGSNIAEEVYLKRPFYNLESLILFSGIDEDYLVYLDKRWFTVYGNGKINFNTAEYNIINSLKGLESISIQELSSRLKRAIPGRFDCGYPSDSSVYLENTRESVFVAINILKNLSRVYDSINSLDSDIITSDNVKSSKAGLASNVYHNLYSCCMNKYEGENRQAYCQTWADSESEDISYSILRYILNVVIENLDIKSYYFKADISSMLKNITNRVTIVLNHRGDIKYWYLHYYDIYED